MSRRSGFLLFVLLAAAPRIAAAVTPSPSDWRDLMIYQVITDRFTDGDPLNNFTEGSFDAAVGNRTHGGDFQGLRNRLDYLKTLGVGAIWISPVVLNAYGEYHGYAARDFYSISSQMGGLGDLQEFIDAAHARGIYVVIDVVLNHTGDLIGSMSANYPAYRSDPSPYVLKFWNATPRQAAPFNNLAWYHNNGNIGNFNDPEQILGELFGLDDLKTELPAVRDALVDATTWLIDNTDCDGFRIDTVKHTELGLWQDWAPRVQAHCQAIGKNDFLMFGEVFDGSDAKNGLYTGTQGGGAYALNSILYYPMHFTSNDVFIYNQPTSRLTDRYGLLSNYDATTRDRLVTFLDNHDNARFLAFEKASQDTTKLRVALDWLLTSIEIPCLYYGTEQMFDGGGDPWCREDMWDGGWDFGPSEGDNFNMTHPLYLRVSRLNNFRRLYPALTRGTQTLLQHDASGSGLYIYSRRHLGEEVLVAVNTASSSRTSVPLSTTFGSGLALADLADTALALSTNGSGQVTLTVPGRSARFVTRRSGVQRLDPHVVSQSPVHDARNVPSLTPVVLTFNEPMDTISVMSRLDVTPIVTGAFSWSADRRRVTFSPLEPMDLGVFYTVTVAADARDATGRPLRGGFETRFRTGSAAASGVVVESGYEVEVYAEAGLVAPEGLAFGPGTNGWTTDLHVGDELQDRVLRVTGSGVVSTLATSATLLQKPEGFIIDATGNYQNRLIAADNTRYVQVTSGGSPSGFGPLAAQAQTGTIVQAPAGAFLGRLYTSSVADDAIYRLDPAGTLTVFATGLGGAEGLAFGPGGDWGTDLYVADADLSSLAPTIDGDAAIHRVNSAGAPSLFLQDTANLAGAAALVFDTVGKFGGDLFVADVLHEKILRVNPSGAITTFASGFGNLFASGCLAFGPDGALYVADTGAGQPFTDGSGGTAVGRVLRIVRLDTTEVPEPKPPIVQLAASPNPFATSTRLLVSLPLSLHVRIDVLDAGGRRVARLLDENVPAAIRSIDWDGTDDAGRRLPSGVYFARLTAGGIRSTVKLVVKR